MRAIQSRRAPFKILIKTKDDPYFLERWIRHHAAIVGIQNLVIFDNASTDPDALQILKSFAPDLLSIRYTDVYNRFHSTRHFGDLYEALARSCDRFINLDTDEFLTLIREHRYFADRSIPEFISDHPGAPTIPCVWLPGVLGAAEVFSFGVHHESLAINIRNGKPVKDARLKQSGFVNHNYQVRKNLLSAGFPAGLFIQHLSNLSPAQRVKGNVNKLIARGLARRGESVEQIIARHAVFADPAMHSRTRFYFEELCALRSEPEPDPDKPLPLREYQFALRPDFSIEYFDEAERSRMSCLLSDGSKLICNALEIAAPESS